MTMYYLFMTKKSDLDLYKKELDRVCEAIEQGKTPVFNEMRNGAVQKEMGSPNYFKFTREFKSAKI